MTNRFLSLLLLFGLALGVSSCAGDNAFTSRLNPIPGAFGSINSVTVVADSSLWLNGASDSIAYFLEAPYIILPQPEPIFDVRFIEPEKLSAVPTFRELRNYVVLADISDKNSPTTKMVVKDLSDAKIQQVKEEGFSTVVARNKWATGQQLIYLMGKNREELLRGMSSTRAAVVKRIADSENLRMKETAFFQGVDKALMDTISQRTGARIRVPYGYELVPVRSDDFVWFKRGTRKGSMNIMVTKVPYENQEQLSKEGLKTIRDQIGKRYVSSSLADTYMRVNDKDLPLFTETTDLNGAFAIEGRGIWEMENDFQGGPFISYLINDEANRQLVLVDGFILAPGEKKRDLMGELEQILATTKVN
ncbi:DUF4837 family protein [Lewinella sp. 4G2]|uniref:DUF4837 family protein n=1 Tax=Lewinella sp. 4G2 TaxID=1803372 RepID=UPI0007B4F4D2|nr:DUF4837 family protein [Lewinella sp. 4G2]OAV42602.1 hypothetical protein A3850_015255 [Lewinella sp. 4G2]